MFQFPCIYAIVFDCIGIFQKLGMFKARYRMNHSFLNIARERARKTIWIDDFTLNIFRFKHHMMLIGILETNDLILN